MAWLGIRWAAMMAIVPMRILQAALGAVVVTVAVVIVSLSVVAVARVLVVVTVTMLAAGAVAAAAARLTMTVEGVAPRLVRVGMHAHCCGNSFWLAGVSRVICSLMRTSRRSLLARARWWELRRVSLVWGLR